MVFLTSYQKFSKSITRCRDASHSNSGCTGWCYRAHVMSSALHTPPPSDRPTCTREPSEGCVPVTSAVRMPPALARSAGHLEPRTLSCWTHEEPPGGSRRNEGASTLNTCTQPPRGRAGHSLTYSSLVHGNKMTSTHPHIFRHFPKKKRDFSWGWPCPSDPAMIGLLLSARPPSLEIPKGFWDHVQVYPLGCGRFF